MSGFDLWALVWLLIWWLLLSWYAYEERKPVESFFCLMFIFLNMLLGYMAGQS